MGYERIATTVLWIGRANKIVLTILIALLTFGIALLDHITGPLLAVSYFYLIPIILGSLAFRLRGALSVALVCAATWVYVQIVDDFDFSTPFYLVWSAAMRAAYYLSFAVLSEWLRGALVELSSLSLRDPLTKAANWRFFEEYYRTAIMRSRRGDSPLTLAFFDIDSFKSVNDKLGHAVGDDVLKTVADSVLPNIRPDDIIARLGGDEFVIALADLDFTGSEEVLARIFASVEAAESKRGHPVTFSVGAITWVEPPETLRAALDAADTLMYEVKRGGKNGRRHQSMP